EPVPPGEPGELVVSGPTVTPGYVDLDATDEAFSEYGFHTGDVGYLDEDGYLHFVANEKNSIYRGKIAGNISSLEIESVIESHPDVRASAVVGVETPDTNEAIKAVVVPEAGESITPVDVSRHCETQLPWLKVPRYVEVRSKLPRAPSGKIRKGDLGGDTSDCWDRRAGYELSR
ncbi:MAG: class I adenylate-forming enzyme family protein, partial [Halobacteriales archaeon]